MSTEDLSYFQEEEFKEHLASYEQMLEGGQPVYLEADELTDIAEYYTTRNEMDKAMACIRYALSLHPGSVDPLVFLARQKMFEGNLEEAKTIRDCITDKNDREVVFLNAELLLREDKEREAAAYLSAVAETEEEAAALFAYDTAVLFLDYGCLKLAAQWGQRALDMEPDNAKFLKFKADYLIASNHLKEAIGILDNLLDNNPYDLNVWHSLGEAHFVNEDFPKTIETADFALAIDEHDAQALLLKANSHLQLQNFDEAHSLYLKYFKEHPANEIPYLFDGICLAALMRYDEALERLTRAEELSQGYSPEQQHIYASLSDVYARLHNIEKAFEYVEKIKDINEDYDANLYKGHILMLNGMKEEAHEYFEKFILAHENPGEAHFLVGVSAMENSQYEEAQEHFRYTLAHDTTPGKEGNKAYAYLAICALMLHRHEESLDMLKTACEKAPDTLEHTIFRQYIPSEVAPEDFYQYLLNHTDVLRHIELDS